MPSAPAVAAIDGGCANVGRLLGEGREVALLHDGHGRHRRGVRHVVGDLAPNPPERHTLPRGALAVLAGRPGAATLRGRPHVLLGDDLTGRPQAGQLDAELGRQGTHPGKGPWAGGAIAVGGDLGEHLADRRPGTLGHQDPVDRSRDRRGNLDDRLVGLHLDERLIAGDRVALSDQPSDDLGPDEPLSQVREPNQVGSAQNRRTSSSAATTRSALGM